MNKWRKTERDRKEEELKKEGKKKKKGEESGKPGRPIAFLTTW